MAGRPSCYFRPDARRAGRLFPDRGSGCLPNQKGGSTPCCSVRCTALLTLHGRAFWKGGCHGRMSL